MNEKRFQCSFCKKRYSRESSFEKHTCKEQIRHHQIKTPIGQAAWGFYKSWIDIRYKGIPTLEAFMVSKFYTQFITFAEFVKSTNIPDVTAYIRLMVRKQIPPSMWSHDKAYTMYIEFVDRQMTPNTTARITIDTLFDLSQQYDCEVNQVFDRIPPSDIIQLLRQRQLSPWILLKSSKFSQFYQKSCSNGDRVVMDTIIRFDYWKTKFAENPAVVKDMKLYVDALSL